VGVADERDSSASRISLSQSLQAVLELLRGSTHSLALALGERRGGVGVERVREGPKREHLRARADSIQVRLGRGRPFERRERSLGAAEERRNDFLGLERVGRLEHHAEASVQRVDGRVEPHEPGDGEPRVSIRRPEREARHRVDREREPPLTQRETRVVDVDAEALVRVVRVRDAEQALAAHIEREGRLLQRPRAGDLDLRMRDHVETVDVRPPLSHSDRLAVEAPGFERSRGPHPPVADLAQPDL
jgi:hypothetical protein